MRAYTTVVNWRLETFLLRARETGVGTGYFFLVITSCRSGFIVARVREIINHLVFTLNTAGPGWMSLYFLPETHGFSSLPH